MRPFTMKTGSVKRKKDEARLQDQTGGSGVGTIFLQQKTSDLNMTFEDFVPLYIADMKNRFKESTWLTKSTLSARNWFPTLESARCVTFAPKMCGVAERDDGAPIRSRKSIFSGIPENAS